MLAIIKVKKLVAESINLKETRRRNLKLSFVQQKKRLVTFLKGDNIYMWANNIIFLNLILCIVAIWESRSDYFMTKMMKIFSYFKFQ